MDPPIRRASLTTDVRTGVSDTATYADRDTATQNTKYGGSSLLYVARNGATSTKESFVRFDLDTIGLTSQQVDSATVTLTPTTVSAGATNQAEVLRGVAWGENTLTWNNRPTAAGTAVGSWPPLANQSVNIDVNASVRCEIRLGDMNFSGAVEKIVSFTVSIANSPPVDFTAFEQFVRSPAARASTPPPAGTLARRG